MNKVRLQLIICFYFFGPDPRSQLGQSAVRIPQCHGSVSSDAGSVSGVWVVSLASKTSAAIFVSDASNGNGNISRNISDVINDMLTMTLVMLVRLCCQGRQ